MSPSTEADISIKYARLHGLSIDYLAEPPPTAHIETLQQNLPSLLTDDASLQCIGFPIHVDTTEHLIVDKEAAFLLQYAHNGLTSPKEIEGMVLSLLDFRHTKKLRVETALLRSDHDSDVRSFAAWEDSHIRDGCLPSEPLDIELDVGLEWPRRLRGLPSELMKELRGERLEVAKEEMIYLQAKIKENWTTEDEEALWDKIASYRRDSLLRPLTPPLFPMSPPPTPYIPSSPACHLPILSDPASLISQDLEHAEMAIFEDDTLTSPTQCHKSSPASSVTISNISNLKQSIICSTLSQSSMPILTEPYVKADDRKVEVPLLAATPIKESLKAVKFSEIVGEMLLDPFSRLGEGDASLIGPEEEIDKFFQDAFGIAADETMRCIEQEQLQESDSKSRVEVPIIDFTLPNPPWTQVRKMGDGGLIAACKTDLIDMIEKFGLVQTWPGIKRLEPKLRWTVFPRELAQVAEESFGDEDILETYIGHTKDSPIIDSGGLIWKPLGFRILKDESDDEEDELQDGLFEEKQKQDILSLVKKRKMLFDEEGPFDAWPSKIPTKATPIDPAMSADCDIEEMIQRKTIKQSAAANFSLGLVSGDEKLEQSQKRQSALFDGGVFSATDALDNYLEIRASKKQKSIGSVYFAEQAVARNSPIPEHRDSAKDLASIERPRNVHQALPVPSVDIPTSPTPYIISSAILKHRTLIRALNSLFPAAIPIERDFTAHNTTSWMANSITRSPVPSALASEADLIISPSTGIILTTLQKIKQKPLPGQKAKSAFKGRIEAVSTRYERLVILVSEASDDEFANGLSELDTLALAEVIGFCSSLETPVVVQFVAGGERTLAKWLVGAMVQYGIQGPASVPLLEDETLWELFLRRAGMNAYASQAIIASLKAPEGVNELGASKAGIFGITAFVEMGQEERRMRFGAMLGGVRVLDAVGRVLDAEWI